MDILTNKYISPDEIKQIAYKFSSNDIINFCRINKFSDTICSSKEFWTIYIDNDQEKYHKLLHSLAKTGSLILFKRLWGSGDLRPNNIISEPLSLIIWKTAFLNGHKYMAKYIYTLHAIWYEQFDKPDNITAELFQEYIEKTYSAWDEVKIFLSDRHYRKQFKEEIFRLLLEIAISQEDYDSIVAMLQDPPIKKRYVFKYLGEIHSISFLNKLLKVLKDFEYNFDKWSLGGILGRALLASNIKLAKYMLKKYPYLQDSHEFIWVFHSYSPDVLKFIEKYFANVYIQTYSGAINNRDILYYMLDRVSETTSKDIIFNSYRAFYPHEYTDLITERMGCLSKIEQTSLITKLLLSGDYYMAKVVIDEVAVCDE